MKVSIATVALCCLASVSFAEDLKKSLTTTHLALNKALQKRDFATFEKVMKATITKDFKYVEGKNSMSFDQMLANMKMGLGGMKEVTSSTSKILSIKMNGKTAVVSMSHGISGSMMGPDKKAHKMVMTGSSKDEMVLQNGKWLMKSMNWTNDKMLMDGKPFNPAAPQGAAG